jgi:tRNA dimethylallyltransferase
MYENQALAAIEDVFKYSDYALVTGGSGLYIDAICQGIDDLPDINDSIRNEIKTFYKNNGIQGLRLKLKSIDPEFYNLVDLANPNRMIRAIEVFLATGQKFSSLRKNTLKSRNFNTKVVILNRERSELNSRINDRVDLMLNEGLIEEFLYLRKYRALNALNTVGYKELFNWIDNRTDLKTAIEKIKTNSRRYAKRQITWFKKYNEAAWFHPENIDDIINYIFNDKK